MAADCRSHQSCPVYTVTLVIPPPPPSVPRGFADPQVSELTAVCLFRPSLEKNREQELAHRLACFSCRGFRHRVSRNKTVQLKTNEAVAHGR